MAADTPLHEQTPYTRRWLRYKVNAPVRVIFSRSEKTVVADGLVLEMSEGGLCVLVGTELTVGSVLDIELTSPYFSRPTRVRGEVRNCQAYRYGIEFMPGNDQELQVQQLRDILRSATGCC